MITLCCISTTDICLCATLSHDKGTPEFHSPLTCFSSEWKKPLESRLSESTIHFSVLNIQIWGLPRARELDKQLQWDKSNLQAKSHLLQLKTQIRSITTTSLQAFYYLLSNSKWKWTAKDWAKTWKNTNWKNLLRFLIG